MSEYVRVARTHEIAPGTMKRVEVAGRGVVVVEGDEVLVSPEPQRTAGVPHRR